MELSHLKYACVLAEEHNFSKAAERLFISQPTLSQQIGRLEHELGMKLFHRTTHSVETTPYGEVFVEQAQRVLGEFDHLSTMMKDMLDSQNNSVSIGIMPSFSAYGIPETLALFKKKYPQCSTKLTMEWSGQLIEKLLRRELDIAFVNADDTLLETLPENIKIEPFLDDQLMYITGESGFMHGSKIVEISALADLPFLAPPKDASIHQLLENMFKEHGISPNVVCVCTTIESLINLVRSNVGITVMSSGIAKQYPGIRMLPLSPSYHLQTCVAYDRSVKPNPAKRLLLNYLNGLDKT